MKPPGGVLSILIMISSALCLGSAQQPQPPKDAKEPKPLVVIDYGLIFEKYDAARAHRFRNRPLDAFAEELRARPGSQGYLLSYGGRVSYVGEAKERARKVKRYLVEVAKLDGSRIEIIDGGHCAEWVVELWVWAGGAPAKPSAQPCLSPKEVKLIGSSKRGRKKQRLYRRAANKSFERTAR